MQERVCIYVDMCLGVTVHEPQMSDLTPRVWLHLCNSHGVHPLKSSQLCILPERLEHEWKHMLQGQTCVPKLIQHPNTGFMEYRPAVPVPISSLHVL